MPASRTATHLDPRGPLVLDTHELGRRPGSMRRVERTIPAPGDWELELVRVPAGADVELDLRLEAVMDGVLVSGTVRAPISAECGRCLEPVAGAVHTNVQELFAYEPDAGDADLPTLHGDLIDLEPIVRDAVVLGLPLNPVCDDECTGLCPGCGGRLSELDPDHSHDSLDPRWAALSGYAAEDGTGPTAGTVTNPARPEIGS